jgi:hypothetical protein
MKKLGMLAAFVAALAFSIGAFAAAEKAVTIEGTLVDSKCYAMDNSLTGNDHGAVKGCGTMCLKAGTPAGILTKDKKFYAVLAPAPVLADHVGAQARVTGKLMNGSIAASKVEIEKGGKWEEVKLGAMM